MIYQFTCLTKDLPELQKIDSSVASIFPDNPTDAIYTTGKIISPLTNFFQLEVHLPEIPILCLKLNIYFIHEYRENPLGEVFLASTSTDIHPYKGKPAEEYWFNQSSFQSVYKLDSILYLGDT